MDRLYAVAAAAEVAAFAAALGGSVLAAWAGLVRRAGVRRRELGAPAPLALDAEPGAVVCVEGVVRIDGDRAILGWSGPAAPAASQAPFSIDVAGREVPVHAPAEIVVGAVETFEAPAGTLARAFSAPTDLAHADVMRSVRLVRSGDRVLVRARLAREAATAEAPTADARGGTYRVARSNLVLEAFDARGVVLVAGARPPRPSLAVLPRGTTWRVAAACVAAGAALVVSAVFARPAYTTDSDGPIVPDPRPSVTVVSTVACSPELDDRFARGDFASIGLRTRYPSARCALRVAEARLAAHVYADAAEAVHAYATELGGDGPQDVERRQALGCIADALVARGGGRDASAARERLLGGVRAMCRALYADLSVASVRAAVLGDLDFVWGDNQGMEFAKGPVRRVSAALLAETGATPSEVDEGRYAVYPEAFLAKNEPLGTSPPYVGKFAYGDDVGRIAWEAKKQLDTLPYALFEAMTAAGRPSARDTPTFRLYVRGNLALFHAATGDAAGAERLVATLRDVPDDSPHAPYWTRPRVADVEAAAAALERGEPPFRMRGELWGALGAAIARHDEAAVVRLRTAVLDRDAAVPLHFLETFARR